MLLCDPTREPKGLETMRCVHKVNKGLFSGFAAVVKLQVQPWSGWVGRAFHERPGHVTVDLGRYERGSPLPASSNSISSSQSTSTAFSSSVAEDGTAGAVPSVAR